MSEETQSQETQSETIDPIITKAAAAGWKPLDQFEGDPDQWVDAKEFVGRAPLYEKNHKLKKEVAELKTVIHEVKGHISKVSQAAYDKAVRDLTAQRDEAIEAGDKTAVKEFDKALKDAEAIKTPADNVHPAIKAWEKENGDWFYADAEIQTFGLAFAQGHLQRNPEDFEGAMVKMEAAIKKAFPDKFETTRDKRKDPPAVESGGRSEGKKTFTKSDLNDEQRKVMNSYVRNGVMTEDQYIKDLVEIGVLGGKK